MFWRKKKPEPITSFTADFSAIRMGITMEGNFGIIIPVQEISSDGKVTTSLPSFQCTIEQAEAIAKCALDAIRGEKKIRANPH